MNDIARRRRSGMATWFDHHVYSLVASAGRLLRKPLATGLTVGVMAIALALPIGLWAALQNVERFAGDVRESRRVSVYLAPEIDAATADAVAAQVRARADVERVDVRTPTQGLAELRGAGTGDAIEALGSNPLPYLILVTPRGDEVGLARTLGELEHVDLVLHDAAWRARLTGWLGFGERLAWVLGALLGAGALLVVGNTVRLDIQSRREELGVLQLLGATNGFIRRPFLYLGASYGLLAGTLALALLSGIEQALRAPLHGLAASYGSGFALAGFTPSGAAAIVLGAGILGWLGAGLVTGHYLRQTRPDT